MLKRWVVIASLLFASTSAGAEGYPDVYYSRAEPGWGVFLVQSDVFQFLAFFIYGPDGKPTWYTAQLVENAGGSFTGALYATTGTYFANAWQGYSAAAVGTASFQPTDAYHATLRYSFTGGPTIEMSVERQTLTPYQLAGNYSGSMSGTVSACPDPTDNDAHFRGRYNLAFTQTGDSASTQRFTFVDTEHSGIVCTGAGPITHFGTRYKLNGQFSCSGDGLNPAPTPALIDSYHLTGQGIEGRLTTNTVDGGRLSLRFAAVLNN